ncbi:MAG: hypothetical protein O2V44_01225 [Candidatus Bathyarchaeota archaeon]|nr:hypothetical protein [Candidatus Bathyarchaeota archaeon]
MVSRSTKLKIFLLADLVILAFVIPSYFYVDAQILQPANFQVTDLTLDSDWVQVGEPIQISVNVTNIGDKSGNYTVTPAIDDIPISTKTVQLSGGETTTVIFTATEPTEGNHTITIGSVTKTFKVTSETPTKHAELRLTNLVTSRKEAEIGDPITVSVTATNIGDEAGEFSLELFVNNQKRETKSIQLDAGKTTSVQFEIVENAEGEYVVTLGSLTTSFRITSEAQSVKPAEFQVTDLTVNPSSALAGEVVEISVKVTNVGEATGNYTVNLKIDGATRDTKDVTLAGQATDVVEFEVTETNAGTYNVEIDGVTGSFTVEAPVDASDKIDLLRVFVSPYEVWEDETVTVTVKANNTANEEGILSVRLLVAGEVVETKQATLAARESDGTVEFTVTAGPSNADTTKGYPVEVINLGNQSDTLKGYFVVAPDGFHTLSINRAGGGSKPMIFTLDGVTYESPYVKLLPEGEYSISTDKTVDVGTGIVEFSHWNDGVTSESRTLTLDRFRSVLAHYIVISGYASCPSLYIWNGTDYVYITEVSNAGWLGYMDYINEDGDIVFGGGNPWDHVKLDKSQLQPRTDNGYDYYDVVLFQQWDEIFYLDTAYLVAVDHPSGTDVYSTMVNYVNRGFYGQIYTVKEDSLLTPISATNEKGDDVLSQIGELDGIFTQGSNGVLSPSWDNITLNQLTLNLGNLSGAPEIKLVINGMIDWGPPEPYYEWIDQFKTAFAEGLVPNGTQINPPPYMEVMDTQGNWVRVPQDRQMPTPADYVPRTFAIDLNGLFPADVTEYKIRITNFWNVTFDYIGIDISPQENITVNEILPAATLEPLEFAATTSTASGKFTKYGDVTELLLEADDMFVIGMQGDTISLKFPTSNLPPLEEGTERSFFLFVASWFKDPPGNWGYGFDFTVDPLPFQNMSGFPYPDTESYPTSEEYIQYLEEWNTRAVNVPEKNTGMELVAELMKFTVLAGVAIAGILVTLIWKKS